MKKSEFMDWIMIVLTDQEQWHIVQVLQSQGAGVYRNLSVLMYYRKDLDSKLEYMALETIRCRK